MNVSKLIHPFWKGEMVFDETIILMSEHDEEASADLFFCGGRYYIRYINR